MMTGNEIWDFLCECGAANVRLAERDNFERWAHVNGLGVSAYRVVSDTRAGGYATISLRRNVGRENKRAGSMPKIAGVLA